MNSTVMWSLNTSMRAPILTSGPPPYAKVRVHSMPRYRAQKKQKKKAPAPPVLLACTQCFPSVLWLTLSNTHLNSQRFPLIPHQILPWGHHIRVSGVGAAVILPLFIPNFYTENDGVCC